jgi:methylmalonyl-CoA mutase N-terminal domain/subunit
VEPPLATLQIDDSVEQEQRSTLQRQRLERNSAEVQSSLADLRVAAASDSNLVPSMLEAARHEATLGEICGVLRELWRTYSEAPSF